MYHNLDIEITPRQKRPQSAPISRPRSSPGNTNILDQPVTGGHSENFVDLRNWRKNKDFSNFLFGSEWVAAGQLLRTLNDGDCSAKERPRSAVRRGNVRRLLEWSKRKATRLQAEVNRERMGLKMEEERRRNMKEILRCVQCSKNKISKGLNPFRHTTYEVADLTAYLLTVFSSALCIRTVHKKKAVEGAVTAMLCVAVRAVMRPQKKPQSRSSDVVRSKLLQGSAYTDRRKYVFRAMTRAALNPRLTPPPPPVYSPAQRAPKSYVERRAQTTMFSIGPSY
eukprot:TRINITY_DN8680_c0_g2_i1.p1 TRINITY_DN8680_c0_g2~~TRINITY_DN8680_c0_g2_i1.p1  ORF type:complete len:281 (+),score=40.47 TRINITY_DN8680_c0_g2_i1:55-897(+)